MSDYSFFSAPQLKRDPLGAMLDFFKVVSDPDETNAPVASWLRWPLAMILVLGFGFCTSLSIDTVRHWQERPNPAFWLAFLGAVEIGAGVFAVKLLRGDRIVAPVRAPPRPVLIRVLGFVAFVTCTPIALISTEWSARIELGVMALSGLALMLAPRLFFPRRNEHGA